MTIKEKIQKAREERIKKELKIKTLLDKFKKRDKK
jgi:hypothetical protein